MMKNTGNIFCFLASAARGTETLRVGTSCTGIPEPLYCMLRLKSTSGLSNANTSVYSRDVLFSGKESLYLYRAWRTVQSELEESSAVIPDNPPQGHFSLRRRQIHYLNVFYRDES